MAFISASSITAALVLLFSTNAFSLSFDASITPSTKTGPAKKVPVIDAKAVTAKLSTTIQSKPTSSDVEAAFGLKSLRVHVPFAINRDRLDENPCSSTYTSSTGCDLSSLMAKTSYFTVDISPYLKQPIEGTMSVYYAGPGKVLVLLELPQEKNTLGTTVTSTGTYKTTPSGTVVDISLKNVALYTKLLVFSHSPIAQQIPDGLFVSLMAKAKFGYNHSLVVTQCPKRGWKIYVAALDSSDEPVITPYRKTIHCKRSS